MGKMISYRVRSAIGWTVFAMWCSLIVAGPAYGSKPLKYSDGMETLSSQLLRELPGQQVGVLAVAEFQNTAGPNLPFGVWLADELGNRLAALSKHPKIAERRRLAELLKEQELGATGLLDSATAATVGKLLGVDAVILGRFTLAEDFVSVSARAVSVNTSEVIGAVAVRMKTAGIPKNLFDAQRAALPEASPKAAEGRRVLGTWTAGPLEVEVTGLQRKMDHRQATVELTLINTQGREILVGIEKENWGLCSASLKDGNGAAHPPLAGKRGSGIACVTTKAKKEDYTRLPPGSTDITMTFKANEGDLILGQRFLLSISFVDFTSGVRAKYSAGFGDLLLEE